MYKFEEGFYTDVRIEEVYETLISYTLTKLDESRIRKYKAFCHSERSGMKNLKTRIIS